MCETNFFFNLSCKSTQIDSNRLLKSKTSVKTIKGTIMTVENEIRPNISIERKSDFSLFSAPVIDVVPSTTEITDAIIKNLEKVIEWDNAQEHPMFLDFKHDFIKKLARKVALTPKRGIIIGVAGESASGKTTLVKNTVKSCIKERKAGIYTVITSDDYFKDTSKELTEAGSYESLFKTGFSFDRPDALNLDLMKKHIIELSKGNPIQSPEYNFVTCESSPDGELKNPAKIILTEGLFTLGTQLRSILDIAVFVYTPHGVIKERWYKRAISRGKTGAAADLQFQKVNSEADTHIRPTINNADIVVNGLVSAEYIESLADKIYKAVNNALKNEKSHSLF